MPPTRIATLMGAGIVLLGLLVPPTAAQSPYSDTPGVTDEPGAARVPALVEAYNSGDPETIAAAVQEHFVGEFAEMPSEEHVSVWQGSLRQTGSLSLLGFRSYDPPQEGLVAILQSEVSGGFHAFVLFAEPTEPHRFLGMQMAPARTPSFLERRTPLEGDALAEAVDELIDRLVEHDMFSGTVVIARDGQPIYERAAGLASRRFDVPNRIDTKFNLGSMNKMFTAVAIAKLAESGALSFDDKVGGHLPDFPNARIREDVEIRHLLSHTSGMGSHFTREFIESSRMMYRDIDDYLELFAEDEIAFSPGTNWAYSNAGFYVLGKIVESASGMSYYDFVRDNIYEPAGMTNSDSYDMDIPVKNLAIGYTLDGMGFDATDDGARWLDESGWRNNYYLHSIKGGPAGGGFSTSPDLIAFANAVSSGKLISVESFEILAAEKPELSSDGYGYGFSVEHRPLAGRVVGHGGGFPGINANLDMFLDHGYTVAVMANMDGAASSLAQTIGSMLTGG